MRIFKGNMTDDNEGLIRHLLLAVKHRLPGGDIYSSLVTDIFDRARFNRIMFDLFMYFAGSKISNLLFPKKAVIIEKEYDADGFFFT